MSNWWCCCSDKEAQCELIDQMMQEIIREEFEQEDALALAACLCQTLHSQFEPSILPQELDEELVYVIYAQVDLRGIFLRRPHTIVEF